MGDSVPAPVPGRRRLKAKSANAAPSEVPAAPSLAGSDHPTLKYLRSGLATDAAREFLGLATEAVEVAGIPAFSDELYEQNMEKWGAPARTYACSDLKKRGGQISEPRQLHLSCPRAVD